MNVWSNMNDPREAKQWESTGNLTAIHPYTNAEMTQRLDNVLRRSAHMMSLTLDRDRTPDAEPDSLFHRGWAKAPMWASYADAHKGVCLVLDFPAVCEALEETRSVQDQPIPELGRINCVDRPNRIDITGALATVQRVPMIRISGARSRSSAASA